MDIQVKHKSTENLKDTPVLQQSRVWSKVKQKQGIESRAYNLVYADDDILVLFQDIGGSTIGYIPYGPGFAPDEGRQGILLEELSESLRPLVPEDCIFLRYDLRWESPWAKDSAFFDESGNWKGPPGITNQELRLNINTHNWNLKKANTDILPANTVFIDLKKDEPALLNEMKPKTRYNIGLSKRKGINIRKTRNKGIDEWYSLYAETCRRNRLYLHTEEYFNTVITEDREMEILIAESSGTPLSAMFLAYSGGRATYLYGASSSEKRNSMAPYALQWEAIKTAKARGCTEYDMFGVSPCPDPAHPLYGLYRFKTGFGGEIFHRMGCWDYPFEPEKYELYQTAEINSRGFHLR